MINRQRLAPLVKVLGFVITTLGVAMLLPLGISWLIGDGAHDAYDFGVALTLLSGLALIALTARNREELKYREGFLLVALTWIVVPAFATLPLLFYLPNLSFTDAYFETVSGFTTTGATILSGLDQMAPSINLWRTEMHLIGGMGVIVLVIAVLPLLGIGGRQMFKMESPTPMKDAKLTPRMTETAKGLWLVYMLLTIACFLAFWGGGMTWIDALIHAFTVMGLGGFSSHDASFAYFNSPLLEGITVFFALLAGLNFSTHFLAWRHRSLSVYRFDPEAGWTVWVMLASSLGIAAYLLALNVYPDWLTALRFATFNTVSLATSLGLANADFGLWPAFAALWMLFLGSFAASAGSTGGGIKMMRAILLYKQVYRELTRLLHPRAEFPVKLGEATVPNKIMYAVLAFFFIYVVTIVVLTLLMALTGLDVLTAFTAIVATINNTGPGLGQVGPSTTYAVLTDFQSWICILSMLLGRLELFTLLVLVTPDFWRK